MDKPHVIDVGKLEADLREVFRRRGFSASDAYDLARAVVTSILQGR